MIWSDLMPENYQVPVYARIALDLAGKIAGGELAEGRRISGRSLLAGQYRVSPETIRRSVQLLEDMTIVEARAGSGIFVLSRDNAVKYVERFRVMTGVSSIRDEIRRLMKEKTAIEDKIGEMIERLEEMADRLQNIRSIYPYEVPVPAGSPLIGKTINDSRFWQNTGATIVAIQRDGQMIYSPGPYAVFTENDRLFLTGESGVDARAVDYLR
jgi:K+/H+ antiporter YhaU regulatory subunit KhtT